jgi:hypothetical protein
VHGNALPCVATTGGVTLDATFESPPEAVARLRGCLDDLVSVVADPVLWTSGGPPHALSTLLDALSGIAMQLDERVAQQTRELAFADDAIRESEHKSRR